AQAWPAGTPTVFLASGETFPDALSAASRAGAQAAPLLLTRSESLPDETAAALRRLKPARIVLVGGTGAVSIVAADEAQSYATSGQLTRIQGGGRYATSAAVAALYPAGVETAYLASGEDFPDALAGAALAGQQGAPLLLTPKAGLASSARDELARLAPQEVVVLGGSSAVSEDVLRAAEPFSNAPVRRIGGADRYRTAAAVAVEVGSPSGTTYVASGQDFPDALVGAAAAARDGAPMLLTPKDEVDPATSQSLTSSPPQALYVLGGTTVIYSSTMRSLADYLAPAGAAEQFTPLDSTVSFDWAGQQWSAKEALREGPGPNRWHRSGVELGDQGSVKLKVAKNAAGQWQSAEIAREAPTGYGTFSFSTTSSVLPPNDHTVLGMFTYQHLSPSEGHEEIDIEYSHWNKPGTGPGSITTHKPDPPWTREFSLDYTGPMTHSFLWAPGYVRWRIVRDDTDVTLYERELWGADVPAYVDARMRMNVWLIDGVAAARQEPFEVTFSTASWTPLPAGFTAPPAGPASSPTATLMDAFDGPLQTSRWPGQYQYGTPTVPQGRLDIPLGPGFHGVQSPKEYRLADSSIAVEQVRPPGLHSNSESEVAFVQDERNSVALITVGNDTGRARIRTGGVDHTVDFAYDRVTHRWLRIRQSGSRLAFEASPDGRTWSAVIAEQSSPPWLADAIGQVKLGGGNYDVDDAAGSVQFDNLNSR
ncbi:MAG: cell wall-binding repeat-containing protein, partial [Ornithinimicrobium sp.]